MPPYVLTTQSGYWSNGSAATFLVSATLAGLVQTTAVRAMGRRVNTAASRSSDAAIAILATRSV